MDLVLCKDGKLLEVTVQNFDDQATTPENCAVVQLKVYSTFSTSIKIGAAAHPITIGTPKSTVDAMNIDKFPYTTSLDTYPHDLSYTTTQVIRYSNVPDFDSSKQNDITVEIYVHNETQLVNAIFISCKTWNY